MKDPNLYSFRSVWALSVSAEDAFDALESVQEYSKWWPEVREVRDLDERRVEVRVRSLLPYDLIFVGEQVRQDRRAGVLEMKMSGDLDGFSRFTIEADHEGCRVVFEEQVVANKGFLRRLAWLARPAFIANHRLMMRRGEAGLRTYAAGFSRAANKT